MAKQYFPTTEDILMIMMAELPDGVFPSDRADNPDFSKRSYSSAELRAHAQMIGDLYYNLYNINRDKFVTLCSNDGLTRWEKDLFGIAQDSSKSTTYRKQNVFSKLRATGSISEPTIKSIIEGILTPLGLDFIILKYNGAYNGSIQGAFVLEKSLLERDTWLASLDPLLGERSDSGYVPLDRSLDYAAAGLTAEELEQIQITAYTYEIQIFGNADDETLELIDKQLTAFEPARSTHIITNNATAIDI